jgi:hypothetical protein
MEFTSCRYNTQRGENSFCERPPGKTELFTDMPLICAQPPRNTLDLAMWPSGLGGGAAKENPAASPAVLAGEGAREVLGVVYDRFGY